MLVNVVDPKQVKFYAVTEMKLGPDCFAGFISIPPGTAIFYKDGQHRGQALKKSFGDLLGIEQLQFCCSSVGVMLSFEDDPAVCKMDFVACAKSRPISLSLLTTWDQADSSSHLANEVARTSPLLRGRIDGNGTNIGPKSEFLFTMKDVKPRFPR